MNSAFIVVRHRLRREAPMSLEDRQHTDGREVVPGPVGPADAERPAWLLSASGHSSSVPPQPVGRLGLEVAHRDDVLGDSERSHGYFHSVGLQKRLDSARI